VLHQGGAQLQAAMAAGEVRQLASHIPVPTARNTLLQAYHVGFSTTMNHLMELAAIVALVGAVCAFTLVRQRDFIIPTGPPAGSPSAGAGAGSEAEAPDNASVPAAHA
jgi:hypothetical protein